MKKFILCILIILVCSPVYADQSILKAQKKLNAIGYDAGGSDGLWGKKTHNAVTQFQKDFDIEVTGKLDRSTLAMLFSITNTVMEIKELKIGMTKEEVKRKYKIKKSPLETLKGAYNIVGAFTVANKPVETILRFFDNKLDSMTFDCKNGNYQSIKSALKKKFPLSCSYKGCYLIDKQGNYLFTGNLSFYIVSQRYRNEVTTEKKKSMDDI